LLQRVRDEAHRFAITFHRRKRSRRMTASALDSVRGLGEARRSALVTHFGSVAKLKQASVAEITEVPGIGATTAKAVLEALGAGDPEVPEVVEASDPGSGTPVPVVGDDGARYDRTRLLGDARDGGGRHETTSTGQAVT
ncbi:MAG: helix-hairpin-helix domain-containing protein, partial [Rhodococcus sp. (in: high G+C Gram-positive bacteria)]